MKFLDLHNSVDGQDKCLNMYDVRLEDDAPYCGMQWPPDLRNISSYLAVGPLSTGFFVPSNETPFPAERCPSGTACGGKTRELGRMSREGQQ